MKLGLNLSLSRLAQATGGGGDPYAWLWALNPVAIHMANSYGSGDFGWGSWIAYPADGSSRGSHEWWLGQSEGVDSRDPSWLDAPPRFAFSSGDCMSLNYGTPTAPDWYRTLHFSGRSFSIVTLGEYNGSPNSGICPIFDSGTSDQGGSDVSRGIIFADMGADVGTPGRFRFRIKRDSSGANAVSAETLIAIPSGSVQCLGVSVQGNSTGFLYRNGSIQNLVGGGTTFSTVGTFGTQPSTQRPRLMARGDLAHTTSAWTLQAMALFDRALEDYELMQVESFLRDPPPPED